MSIVYSTAVHRCTCGCDEEVVAPISLTNWQSYFDVKSISLKPSIGNWDFKCRSHYWIKGNAIRWAEAMSGEEIEEGRKCDLEAKANYRVEIPVAFRWKCWVGADVDAPISVSWAPTKKMLCVGGGFGVSAGHTLTSRMAWMVRSR